MRRTSCRCAMDACWSPIRVTTSCCSSGLPVLSPRHLLSPGAPACYLAFGSKQGRRSNADYIGNILEQRHGSVLEHAVWSFLITGVSRALTHELIRHRAGFGYSQESQRYVDETETDFVEPAVIADD